MTTALRELVVGLGELQVSGEAGDVLVALGLGSCVGVCAYDGAARVGGLLHAVLPAMNGGRDPRPTKYVDAGLGCLLEAMERAGARRERLVVCLVGGAQMVVAPGLADTLQIGARNVAAATRAVAAAGLRLVPGEVGGSRGRTVRLEVGAGRLTVRSVGQAERELPLGGRWLI